LDTLIHEGADLFAAISRPRFAFKEGTPDRSAYGTWFMVDVSTAAEQMQLWKH